MYIYLHASGCCNCLTAHMHTRSTSHQSILLCRCLFLFRAFRGSKSCFEVFRQATVQSIANDSYEPLSLHTHFSHTYTPKASHTCTHCLYRQGRSAFAELPKTFRLPPVYTAVFPKQPIDKSVHQCLKLNAVFLSAR